MKKFYLTLLNSGIGKTKLKEAVTKLVRDKLGKNVRVEISQLSAQQVMGITPDPIAIDFTARIVCSGKDLEEAIDALM